ncbi:YpfN family protein [Pantoea sp. Nvir]|nr:YpfN family protein [Pantoea sp. Nvir]MXP66570.1 YpfN family protein [Pantoea sp. Nvir]
MEFIKDHWWIIIVLLPVGVIMNGYRSLKQINHKKYRENKPHLPLYHDLNNKEEDEKDDSLTKNSNL